MRWFTAGWFSHLERCRRRYGDVFRLRGPILGPVIVLADPDAIRSVFNDPTATRAAVRARAIQDLYGGTTVMHMDGPEHLERRRLMLPAFHGEHVEAFERNVAEALRERADDWTRSGRVDLLFLARKLTVAAMVRTLFGLSQPATVTRLRTLFERLGPTWYPTLALPHGAKSERFPGPWRRFARVRRELTDLIHVEIQRRRNRPNGDPGHDLCSLLLSARDEDGTGLTNDDAATELLMLGGVAGTYPTASSIAWMFDYVLHDRATLARLEEDPTDRELGSAVVDETLRIRPAADPIPRMLARDVEVGDYRLHAGEVVIVSPHLLHRREDLYERPAEFRPERFLDERPSSYRWLAFGAGSRRCVGVEFARLEMRVTLQELFGRWRIRPLRPTVSRPRRGTFFIWDPVGGVPASISLRNRRHLDPRPKASERATA